MGFSLDTGPQGIGHAHQRLWRVFCWRRHRMHPEPVAAIVRLPHGGYRSTGDDPRFRLISPRGEVPHGRVMIILRGRRADGHSFTPVLYAEAGGTDHPPLPLRIPPSAAHTPFLCLLPEASATLRLDPMDEPGDFTLDLIDIVEIGTVPFLLLWLGRLLKRCLCDPRWLMRSLIPAFRLYRSNGWHGLRGWLRREMEPTGDYATWVRSFDTLDEAARTAIRSRIAAFAQRPQISVLLPVAHIVSEDWVGQAIASVRHQLYPDWELCIAVRAALAPQLDRILNRTAADARIRVLCTESTDSAEGACAANTGAPVTTACNHALALAQGPFIAVLAPEDALSEDALYQVACVLNVHPETNLLFSDEDQIDAHGRRTAPNFKSGWNPDLMLSQNACGHLGVYRRTLVDAVGGFHAGYEGCQEFDLVLRLAERTSARHIRHVPRILYHRRTVQANPARKDMTDMAQGDIAPTRELWKEGLWDAGRRAIARHLHRRGITATVEAAVEGRYYRVRYPLPDPAPRVSLLVPTRDRLELLQGCIEGLRHRTDYPDLEILIIDNDSREPATHAYLAAVTHDPRVRVLPFSGPFNYSALNNAGVRAATGEIIGLINNDIQVIHADWLREMVSHAVRPEIGAVGALLYYGNDTVQHAGVVMGMSGLADHLYRFLPRGHSGYFGRCGLIQNLSAVTAACLLVRRHLFLEVGGLDAEHLKVAFNDVDFCLRLVRHGYRNLWTPFACLYHLESASRGSDDTPSRRPEFLKEIAWMNERWSGVIGDDPYFNPNLSLTSNIPTPAFPPRLLPRQGA